MSALVSAGCERRGGPAERATGAESLDAAREGAAEPRGAGAAERQADRAQEARTFTATAYALDGLTAAGTQARRGVVAADPDVLPLGTRIRVSGAGRYSGEYVVEDTGAKVQGRKIDIKVESKAEAVEFGEQTVEVEVLERGSGDREQVQEAAAD